MTRLICRCCWSVWLSCGHTKRSLTKQILLQYVHLCTFLVSPQLSICLVSEDLCPNSFTTFFTGYIWHIMVISTMTIQVHLIGKAFTTWQARILLLCHVDCCRVVFHSGSFAKSPVTHRTNGSIGCLLGVPVSNMESTAIFCGKLFQTVLACNLLFGPS